MMNDVITIVSGLPRSGTSMMMRMLEAGGMPVVTDYERRADDDNPLGYYEFESVKNIKSDPTWLKDAVGKAVKMVSMLLYELPPNCDYLVIFMQRQLDEILMSQRVMLERKGEASDFDAKEMAVLFRRHLDEIKQWLVRQAHMKVLFVNYSDMLDTPRESAGRIRTFLGRTLDVDRMAEVVDRSLYRQRLVNTEDAEKEPHEPLADENDKQKVEDQLRALGYM